MLRTMSNTERSMHMSCCESLIQYLNEADTGDTEENKIDLFVHSTNIDREAAHAPHCGWSRGRVSPPSQGSQSSKRG